MNKENQAAKAKPGKKTEIETRGKDESSSYIEQVPLCIDLSCSGEESLVKKQAARLGDRNLQSAQRQALGAHIGQVQGNRHLQRVMAQVGQNEHIAPQKSGTLDSVLQAKPSRASVTVTVKAPHAQDPERIASRGIASPSSALPYKAEMEQAFEQDFSSVRAHTGSVAHTASTELGAKAYTLGNDIVFGDSTPDKEIVAHELAHIVQHGTSSGAQLDETTSKNTPTEYEARAAQQATAKGQKLPPITETLPSSSIAGDWYIQDRNNYWQINYSPGETPADDCITASFISQRIVTQEGAEEFTTEVTPAPLSINVLLSRSGLPPGSLIEDPRNPSGGEEVYYVINPRLGADRQETIRSELSHLQSQGTVVQADIEPAPEITGPPMSPEQRTAPLAGGEQGLPSEIPSTMRRDHRVRESGAPTPLSPRERTAPLAGGEQELPSEIPSTMRRGHRVQQHGGGAPTTGYVYVYNSLAVLAARLRAIPNRGYLYNRMLAHRGPVISSADRPPMPNFTGPLTNHRQQIPSNCIYLVYALPTLEAGLMGVGRVHQEDIMTLTPPEGTTAPVESGPRGARRGRVGGGVGLGMDLFHAIGWGMGQRLQIGVVVYQPTDGSPFHAVYFHQAGSWNIHTLDWVLRELGETEEQTEE